MQQQFVVVFVIVVVYPHKIANVNKNIHFHWIDKRKEDKSNGLLCADACTNKDKNEITRQKIKTIINTKFKRSKAKHTRKRIWSFFWAKLNRLIRTKTYIQGRSFDHEISISDLHYWTYSIFFFVRVVVVVFFISITYYTMGNSNLLIIFLVVIQYLF